MHNRITVTIAVTVRFSFEQCAAISVLNTWLFELINKCVFDAYTWILKAQKSSAWLKAKWSQLLQRQHSTQFPDLFLLFLPF